MDDGTQHERKMISKDTNEMDLFEAHLTHVTHPFRRSQTEGGAAAASGQRRKDV